MNERLYRFEHGDASGAILRILPDETRALNDLLPEAFHQADNPRITLSYTCCYLQHQGQHILVDAGIDGDEVTALLGDLGVSPEEIELVCITHVDRDHVGGLLLQIGDGELAYPNARYAIGSDLWTELHKPETYDALPKHLRRLFQRLKELIEDRVILCQGESKVAKGITFVPCPGHRPGHAAYAFATDETPILHIGDVALHPVWFEHLDWPVNGDSLPEQAMESRRLILDRIRTTHALAFGTHLPWPGRISP